MFSRVDDFLDIFLLQKSSSFCWIFLDLFFFSSKIITSLLCVNLSLFSRACRSVFVERALEKRGRPKCTSFLFRVLNPKHSSALFSLLSRLFFFYARLSLRFDHHGKTPPQKRRALFDARNTRTNERKRKRERERE